MVRLEEQGVGRGSAGIIYTLIGKALASSSNFFINYIMVQALMTMPYRMVLPTVMPLLDLCRVLRVLPGDALRTPSCLQVLREDGPKLVKERNVASIG